MCQIVGCVGELVRHEILLRILGYHLAGKSYGSVCAFFCRCEDDFSSKRTDDLPSFHRHCLTHDYFHRVAFDDAYDGESYACVA